MAITLNDNLQINAGKPVDSKYLSSSNVPYADVSAANTAIPISYRYQGLKVNINNIEYWYYTGVTNGDLVPLETPASVSGLTASSNGLTDDGVTVCLGGSLTTPTTITINPPNKLPKRFVSFGKYADNSFVDLFKEAGIKVDILERPNNKVTFLD